MEVPGSAGPTEARERRTWVWLIGMADAGDDELRHRAQSFARPPEIQVQGATPAKEPYALERRAWCLTVEEEGAEVAIMLSGACVNPVFELTGAPHRLQAVHQDDQVLDRDRYRWDGATLWLDVSLDEPTTLRLQFRD